MTRKISIGYVFNQSHYQNILMLIGDSQVHNIKITFNHLKNILVKGEADKLSPFKLKELIDYFKYEKPEIWPGEHGKPSEISSVIHFMAAVGGPLEYEEDYIKSVNNLANFLARLGNGTKKIQGLHLIERKERRGKEPYYVMTKKGVIYVHRYLIEEEVKRFLDYVFYKKRALDQSIFMLNVFEDETLKLSRKIINSEENIKKVFSSR